MRCSKAQRLISDHVDNLLEIKDIRSLENHMQECSDCRDLLVEMESIANNAREIKDMEPSKDLWPEIKRQVLQKNQKTGLPGKSLFENFSFYSRRPAFALSALLVIIILIPLIYFGFPPSGIQDNNQERIALEHFRIAEQHYRVAIEALYRALESRDVELSPELAAVFKANLEIIDDSIRICKAAVEKQPGNPVANRLLLVCYNKKIDLLNEIKEITLQTV